MFDLRHAPKFLLPCLALAAAGCVKPDASLAYLCDLTVDGGGCPEDRACAKAEDGQMRCLPRDGLDASVTRLDAGDTGAGKADATEEIPLDAGEPEDAGEPGDTGPRADGGGRPDAGTPPDAAATCGSHAECGPCEQCTAGGQCVLQLEGADIQERCPATECGTGACDGKGACGVKLSTIACRQTGLGCDLDEYCDGVSANCPADKFKSAGTLCHASQGDCDLEERCTGDSAACPTDKFKSAGTTCREAPLACDVVEKCQGTGPDCPPDLKAQTSVECAAAACSGSALLPAQNCDGTNAACPTRVPKSCAPFSCSAGMCLTQCTGPQDCSTEFCDPRTSECVTPVAVDCDNNGAGDLQAKIGNCPTTARCYLKIASTGVCGAAVIQGKDVMILGGTINPGGAGNGVQVRALDSEATVAWLTGTTIQGANGPSDDCVVADGLGTGRPTLTLVHCKIGGYTSGESCGGRGIVATRANITIDACSVVGNGEVGVSLTDSAFTLQSTLIAKNGTGTGYGAYISGSTGTFRFNTVAYNGGGVQCVSATTNLVSSLFYQPSGDEIVGCAVDGSSDIPNSADFCADGTTTHPKFVDHANNDFHLDPTSTCIDTLSCSPPPYIDMDGQPRKQGTKCDVGADEAR